MSRAASTTQLTATGSPFYLDASQVFYSRATSTTQLTAMGSPFYLDASQAFYSRATSATYFDSSGVMQTAATNVARANYDPVTLAYNGILLEPARTNLIRNSTMQGAGTGPSAVWPTNWSRNGSQPSYTIIGTGMEDGIPYMDLRLSSTVALGPFALNYDTVSTTFGTILTLSHYARLIGGSFGNAIPQLSFVYADSVGNTQLRSQNMGVDASPLRAQRFAFTDTVTQVSAVEVSPRLRINSSGAFDFTLRIGAPQLEVGSSPSSYIPTSSTSATRAADVYTQETASYFNNAGVLKYATAGASRTNYVYNGSTWVTSGTLIEPARTNLLKYSSYQTGKFLTGSETTISYNTALGLTGDMDAATLSNGTCTVNCWATVGGSNAVSITSGMTYVYSTFVKPISASFIYITGGKSDSSDGGSARFGLTGSGTILNTLSRASGAYVASGIQYLGSGWYRPWVATKTSESTSLGSIILSIGSDSSVNIWGAQVEQGNVPTSYIPTSGSSASRAADVYTQETASYFNSAGVLKYATAGASRTNYVYNGSTWVLSGTLIEPARTNSVWNSTFAGASVGSPGNPGTGWSYSSYGTLSREISDIGTENGIPYIDVRFYGTNSSGGYIYPQIVPNTKIACTEGQVWTGSLYMRLVGGSLTGVSKVFLALTQHTSGTAYIKTAFYALGDASMATATSLASSRYTATTKLTGTGTTALCSFNFGAEVPPGATVDFTVRFGGVQGEMGLQASSYIPTGVGAAASRASDVYTQETASYFNSSGLLKYATAGASRTSYVYNGSTWVAPSGVLVEPARTNIAVYSNNQTNWTPNDVSCAGDGHEYYRTMAPDGVGVAYSITSPTINGCGRYLSSGNLPVSSNAAYTFSVFVKNIYGSNKARLTSSLSGFVGGPVDSTFDPQTGDFSNVGAGVVSYTAVPYGNGWWRVIMTGITTSATTNVVWTNYLRSTDDGEIAFWGNQIEKGSTATSYIPTYASTASRAKDAYRQEVASYFDSSGVLKYAGANVARSDYSYNGSSWVLSGTLVEPARSNLILSSNDLNTAVGGGFSAIQNSASPDGKTDGWLLTQTAADGTDSRAQFNFTVAADTSPYVCSVFIKKTASAPTTYPGLGLFNNGYATYRRLLIDTQTGAISTNAPAGRYGVLNLGSYWRVWVSLNNNNSASGLACQYYPSAASSLAMGSWGTKLGGSAVFFGAQMEAGVYPSSYILTGDVSSSRAADVYTQQTASYFNSAGLMKFALANTARADYDPLTLAYKGILAEPLRINYISNSTMLGAVPGAWPTGWRTVNSGGVTATIVGVGTDSGMTYVDINFKGVGSAVSDGSRYTNVDFSEKAVASTGQNWVVSAYVGYVGGSYPSGSNKKALIRGGLYDSGSNYLNELNTLTGDSSVIDYSGGLKRFFVSNGISDASTAFIKPYFQLKYNQGESVDLTLRFAAPQLEQGLLPSSFIPTSIAPASRAADIYTSEYSGTYFDASGTLRVAPANVPRLDHDPSTGEPRGILIEEARTNSAASNITAYPWSSYGATTLVSNSDVGPDGTMTAHRITCGTTNCNQYLNLSGVSGTTYTFSFFTKDSACSRGRSGTAVGGGITYFSNNLGNGWIRHGFTETVVSPGTWLPQIINYKSVGTPCIVWGPQVEVGTFPTSYIPTNGSTATRAADVFKIPTNTGWFNPAEGTFLATNYGQLNSSLNNWTSRIIGTDVTAISFLELLASTKLGPYTGGPDPSRSCPKDFSLGEYNKSAMTWSVADQTHFVTCGGFSAAGGTTTGEAYAGVGNIAIGSLQGYVGWYLNAPIQRIVFFPNAQPSSTLPDYTR